MHTLALASHSLPFMERAGVGAIPMKSARTALLSLCGTLMLGVWLWSAINPVSRQDWLLENLLVFALVALLLITRRRLVLSSVSYGLLSLFLVLHLYGSHYTYSETPFGFWLSEQLELERNHYDRLVHFAFGLLLTYPLHELLQKNARVSGLWLMPLCLATVMALSSLYEQMEMLAALVVAPDLARPSLAPRATSGMRRRMQLLPSSVPCWPCC
jgi:putative membrane protein